MSSNRQNNFYRIHSSENLAATTSSGTSPLTAVCPAGVTKVRISTTALVYVAVQGGQGATPTAAVASGVQLNISEPGTFTVVAGDKIAAITSSGAATVNVSWLEG